MSDLHCDILSIQFGLVNLPNWSWGYRFHLKFLKHLFNLHSIGASNDLLSLAELMLGGVLSEDFKFFSHILSNNISSMT